VPADTPGETLVAPPPVTRTDAVGWLGCEKIRKEITPVPAPDSYPHVTCGCPDTGRRPPGVVAAVAPAAPKAQRAVPGTRSRPGLPWYRAGEGGTCRAVNMAHTTFPASLGVV